jgi:hypothetical protein
MPTPYDLPDFEVVDMAIEAREHHARCDIIDLGIPCRIMATHVARSLQHGVGCWVCDQHATFLTQRLKERRGE